MFAMLFHSTDSPRSLSIAERLVVSFPVRNGRALKLRADRFTAISHSPALRAFSSDSVKLLVICHNCILERADGSNRIALIGER